MAFSAVLAAVAVGSSVMGVVQGNKAAGSQRKAAEFQRQQADLQAARQKVEAARQARLAYATAAQGAQNAGASYSSAAQGGEGSILSQYGANASFLDQFNYLSDQASIQLGKASQFQANANTWKGISSIATDVFTFGQGQMKKSGGSGGGNSGGIGGGAGGTNGDPGE